jgi:hypothetical protein
VQVDAACRKGDGATSWVDDSGRLAEPVEPEQQVLAGVKVYRNGRRLRAGLSFGAKIATNNFPPFGCPSQGVNVTLEQRLPTISVASLC